MASPHKIAGLSMCQNHQHLIPYLLGLLAIRFHCSLYAPLFSRRKERSDLTLDVTLIESSGPLCDVEIDNSPAL